MEKTAGSADTLLHIMIPVPEQIEDRIARIFQCEFDEKHVTITFDHERVPVDGGDFDGPATDRAGVESNRSAVFSLQEDPDAVGVIGFREGGQFEACLEAQVLGKVKHFRETLVREENPEKSGKQG